MRAKPPLRIGLWRLLPSLIALFGSATALAAEDRQPRYEAEIRRTSYGIPHIRAEDEGSIGYGLGLAFAQDNFCVFADEMVSVNGLRSRYFGPDLVAGPDIDSGYVNSRNYALDVFYRLVNSPERVETAWNRQSPKMKAMLEGYAAGVNRYLSDTGRDRLPEACRNAEWVRPITALDLIRLARRYEVEFSAMRFIDGLAAAQPPGQATVSAQASAAEIPLRDRRAGVGSNALALGRDATANGRGLLFGNPHYPWDGILRFYQTHLTIPGRMDVMGATLPGLPTVIIGFTPEFAWTHTVNTSVHFTLYKLELHPDDATRYRVGDEWLQMERRQLRIPVREENGAERIVTHDLWSSIHGPVLVRPGSLEWTGSEAFAIADANLDNDQMTETWLAMNQARSLDEFEAAVKTRLGMPWINTVAADRGGTALYMSVTPVPNLSDEELRRCSAGSRPQLEREGIFVLSGRDPSCDWDVDPGAPRRGWMAGDRLPVLRRTDFVQNANDSAWMTNPAAPLTGFPILVSRENVEQGGRTRIGIEQAEKRLAGSDGLGGTRFTPALLQRIAFSNRVFYPSLVRDDLLAACREPGSIALEGRVIALDEPCRLFGEWDGTANSDGVGYPLFSAWWERIERNPQAWAVPFSATDPVRTPRGLALERPEIVRFVRESLALAIVDLEATGIDWRRAWGEIQFEEADGERVPVPGGARGEVYNIVYSLPSPAGNGRMLVRSGTSYVQIVGFDESGPVADALLTYSQSTNPESEHHDDQIRFFSRGELIRQPFTDAQIRADPRYSTVTVSE